MNPNKSSAHATLSNKAETRAPSNQVRLTLILETFPQLSWSYSKYMAALKKEEVLLKKQMEASFSTASGTHTHTHSPAFIS